MLCADTVYKPIPGTSIIIYCGMEQLVARWAHNPKVVGSSPTHATNGWLNQCLEPFHKIGDAESSPAPATSS